jgi:hypothetical protein
MMTISRFIRTFRFIALIIAASWLAGCSAIKLAYNQAPTLAYGWLDGYLDFNDQQSPQVRDALNRLFAWHRASELPKTADLLARTAALMSGEISGQQACQLYDQARGLMDSITAQALPRLAELAPSIQAEQISHLQRKYAKNTDEFRRDFMSAKSERSESKRLKRSIHRSEMLYGKLDDSQISVIQQLLAASIFDAATSLRERQRRQQELLDILGGLSGVKASAATSEQALRSYIQRAWESPDPAYRAYAQRLTSQACQSFASIHARTTAAQRAHAVKVLRGYELDLRTLAASQ